MLLAVDVDCPKCGSRSGQRCVDQEEAQKRNHTLSYSFHLERITEAKKQNERKGNE